MGRFVVVPDGDRLSSAYSAVTELGRCVSTQCYSHESIDDVLRTWLDLTAKMAIGNHESQEDVLGCARLLLESRLFQANKDYVRNQIIHSLLQEDDAGPLHAIACLLFLDGRHDGSVFSRMVDEACFSRLLDHIIAHRADGDVPLHRMLLQLMYEMSRIERLKVEDLMLVDDAFVHDLFRAVEGVSHDVRDPYHYPTIRVLVRFGAAQTPCP